MNITDSLRRGVRAGLVLSSLIAPLALSATLAPAARAAAPTFAEAAAGTYSVDKPHTDVSFTVTHLAITKVHGRFNEFDGKVVVDGKKPTASMVEFTIKTASVDTSSTARDTHLKSKDFFDVATFPEITFKSTKIAKSGAGYVATGPFTMHGVTKIVALPFTVVGPVKGMEGGQHLGVSIETTIKRSEYGISAYIPAVGDAITVSIDLDLLKDGSVPPKPAAK